jgi:prepilin-type processing-associated H-X9-DG protein
MQWEERASRTLQFYLDDVRHACRTGGIAADSVVADVEARIQGELARRGKDVVTDDLIERVLTSMGPAADLVPQEAVPLQSPPAFASPPPKLSAAPPPLPTAPPTFRAAPPPMPLAAHASRMLPQRKAPPNSNQGCLLATIIVGVSFLLFAGSMGGYSYYIFYSLTEGERQACTENLENLSAELESHIDPDTGVYPPLNDAEHGELFIFGGSALDDLDVSLLGCPTIWSPEEAGVELREHPDYIYLGYAVRSQEDLDAFIAAYIKYDGDVTAFMAQDSIDAPGGPLVRLRRDLPNPERVPVLIERSWNHLTGGGNVLFLDGHVEFIALEDKFPMTEAFFESLYPAYEIGNLTGCRKNLHALGEALAAVGVGEDGFYPAAPTGSEPFAIDTEILTKIDTALLRCPSSAYSDESEEEIVANPSYFYLGYSVRSQEELELFLASKLEGLPETGLINGTEGSLPRLRAGMAEADSIPLLIEWGDYAHNGGGHVLYLDGHVEFVEYDEKFPVTDAAFTALRGALGTQARDGCRTNLTELGVILATWSGENGGVYPAVSFDSENLLFSGETLERLDANLLRCPAESYAGETKAEILAYPDYTYLGFAVRDQEDMDAFMAAYLAAEDTDGLEALLRDSGRELPRLNVDLESPEPIPVLIEWWSSHEPDGGHVLYLDGHVEYLSMDEKFPVTAGFSDSLELTWTEESAWDIFWEVFWESMEEDL